MTLLWNNFTECALNRICSEQCGMSSLLTGNGLHMWYTYILIFTNLGNALTSLKKSIVNLLGPLLPLSALKPSNGTLDVPVTN